MSRSGDKASHADELRARAATEVRRAARAGVVARRHENALFDTHGNARRMHQLMVHAHRGSEQRHLATAAHLFAAADRVLPRRGAIPPLFLRGDDLPNGPGVLGTVEVLTQRPVYRIVVHQAAGMIAEMTGSSPEDALALLRAHAFAQGRQVAEIAKDVISGSWLPPDVASHG